MRTFDTQTTGNFEAALMGQLRELQGGSVSVADLAGIIPSFPLKVQIQTHTRCNASCGMCPYPEITGEEGFVHNKMDEGLYRSILEQLGDHGLERLSLFLMNEPLLDKRLPQWLTWARAKLPETTLNLFSNGSPITEKLAHQLAEAGLDELCISVHGFDKETYERVMGLNFERSRRSLEAILDLQNKGQLGDMAIKLVSGDLSELSASHKEAPEHLRSRTLLKGFSNERRVSEVQGGLASSIQRACQSWLCQRPFVKLYILWDGSCVLCNADWRQQVILGRISEDNSIQSIWTGARYQALRAMQVTGEFPMEHPCARCDYPKILGTA